MRLIDADALLNETRADYPDVPFDALYKMVKWFTKIVDEQPTVTASQWHRVEEPPKKHGKYPVCWVENGNFYWEEAHYCYYQDGDKWIAWSSFQGDDVEITPDYWMPIEPPKEDA